MNTHPVVSLAREQLREQLRAHRSERRASLLLPVNDAPSAPLSAAGAMTRTGKQERAERAAQKIRRADALAAARKYPLTGRELAERVAAGVQSACGWATEDEQRDAIQRVCELTMGGAQIDPRADARGFKAERDRGGRPLIPTHNLTDWPTGWAPCSDDVRIGWIKRRASGLILTARERAAARELRLADVQGDDDDVQTAEEQLDVLCARASGSVWAAFSAPTTLASTIAGDELADRIAARTTTPLHDHERMVIVSACEGHGSMKELAGSLGIAEGTARKRAHDGRARLLRRTGDADALGMLLADALSGPADDGTTFRPDAEQSVYVRWIDSQRDRAYNRPGTSGPRATVSMAGTLGFGAVRTFPSVPVPVAPVPMDWTDGAHRARAERAAQCKAWRVPTPHVPAVWAPLHGRPADVLAAIDRLMV